MPILFSCHLFLNGVYVTATVCGDSHAARLRFKSPRLLTHGQHDHQLQRRRRRPQHQNRKASRTSLDCIFQLPFFDAFGPRIGCTLIRSLEVQYVRSDQTI